MNFVIMLGLVYLICGTPSFFLLAPYFKQSRWYCLVPAICGISTIFGGYFQ